MDSLESQLAQANDLSVLDLADAIMEIGFRCTRCGGCCTADEPEAGDDGDIEPHTATVFPDEVRRLREAVGRAAEWDDVARPIPYGLDEGEDGLTGETFEWALQTDVCGDCVFYEDGESGATCTVYDDRPLICQTYPFSVDLDGTSQPMGAAVEREGVVRAHECKGLGSKICRVDAVVLAEALKERAVTELEEAIAVRESYEPVAAENEIVVHDSEGAKRPDGRPL